MSNRIASIEVVKEPLGFFKMKIVSKILHNPQARVVVDKYIRDKGYYNCSSFEQMCRQCCPCAILRQADVDSTSTITLQAIKPIPLTDITMLVKCINKSISESLSEFLVPISFKVDSEYKPTSQVEELLI